MQVMDQLEHLLRRSIGIISRAAIMKEDVLGYQDVVNSFAKYEALKTETDKHCSVRTEECLMVQHSTSTVEVTLPPSSLNTVIIRDAVGNELLVYDASKRQPAVKTDVDESVLRETLGNVLGDFVHESMENHVVDKVIKALRTNQLDAATHTIRK